MLNISSLQDSKKTFKEFDGITELTRDRDSDLDLLFFTSPSSILALKVEMNLLKIITGKNLPIKLNKIDISQNPEAAEKYNIVATPTFIFRDLRACGHYELDALENILGTYFCFDN